MADCRYPTTVRHLTPCLCLLPVILITGCISATVLPIELGTEVSPPLVPSDWLPVARYGRYTLVELTPQAAQHNLLLQVVDVSIPTRPHMTVGDGLRHVLQRSGYVLCDKDPQVAALYELLLPAAHLRLGPMFLHDALLTLAGPAWELQVDERARQICFSPTEETSP